MPRPLLVPCLSHFLFVLTAIYPLKNDRSPAARQITTYKTCPVCAVHDESRRRRCASGVPRCTTASIQCSASRQLQQAIRGPRRPRDTVHPNIRPASLAWSMHLPVLAVDCMCVRASSLFVIYFFLNNFRHHREKNSTAPCLQCCHCQFVPCVPSQIFSKISTGF